MRKILKQVVGIDVAQKELVVCLGRLSEDLSVDLYAGKVFPNTPKGFIALNAWTTKLTDSTVSLRYVMEATGVYHEKLAYYLADHEASLTIVLPNKISNYFRTLDVKTITDKTASEAICRFGLERQLDDWKRPNPRFKTMRQLSRERNQVVDERTMVKNHLHAEMSEAEPCKSSIDRINKRIAFLNKQVKLITAEIAALMKEDEEVKSAAKLCCSISGVGIITTAAVLGETNGFALIRNKRQLISYAGLDVREKQSGTSVKGKACISKKGNKHLRKAMHLPALSAIKHDQRFKEQYARLVGKHGIKMKAAVAVQRKLLEMIYVVYKTGNAYDKSYLNKPVEAVV